jgi:NADP-dependent 3-hydroxy acid dehydrogenase YdfG
MATDWGKWSAEERAAAPQEPPSPRQALPPEEVAALILWIVTAPAELVLNEAIVSPLEEAGWP